MIRIYLDAMGGDNAPECNVSGALEALRADQELEIILAGDSEKINGLLSGADDVKSRITVEHLNDVITNHDAPVMAVRQKKDSAQVKGMLAVKEGRAEGFVSAGSTGALLAGGMFRLGRLPGVERPAIASMLPTGKGFVCLTDCGANADCRSEYLPQFGIMGSVYMQSVMGIEKPRVGLVNIGAEDSKGNTLTKEAYPLMQNAPINFIGNVEGRDITAGNTDVAVCDGFSGNLLLKFMEGAVVTMTGIIKQELKRDLRGKLSYLIAKKNWKAVKKRLDYSEVGGAPLLGVSGAVIKAHGSSNAHAISCAIRQCTDMVRNETVKKTSDGINAMTGENKEE